MLQAHMILAEYRLVLELALATAIDQLIFITYDCEWHLRMEVVRCKRSLTSA
jgi:hypothetical protein